MSYAVRKDGQSWRAVESKDEVTSDEIWQEEQPLVIEYTPAITMAQTRKALLKAGLLDKVSAGIASMPQDAQIEWEYATQVRRDSALVAAVAKFLELDDAAVNDLFRRAVSL